MAEHEVSNLDLDTRAVLSKRTAIAIAAVVAAVGALVIVLTVLPFDTDPATDPGAGSTSGSPVDPYAGGGLPPSPTAATRGTDTSAQPTPSGQAPDGSPTEVVVSVQGMVSRPGLLRASADQRVGEAIDLAGGPHPQARLHNINLAERVTDGMQITVTDSGSEVRYPGAAGQAHPGGNGTPGASGSPPAHGMGGPGAGGVSINTADARLLESLPGVGPATAQAIVAHRDSHGPFTSVEQLMEVKGIGPAKFEAIKDAITL
ncbi:ComEA family DNA-binding protein [Corynebacterium falsenii]